MKHTISKHRERLLQDPARRAVLEAAAGGAALAVASPFLVWAAESDKIKIGFPVPLTGPFGAEAKDQVRAGELAVKEFNDADGLNGRMAELVVRDDKLNPGEAATRTLELIEKDKVNFIVGSLSAAVQLSVNDVTKQRGVLYNSISQSDAINEAKHWSRFTFHESMNPHMTAGAVARYAFPKFGKRVVFLTADYVYGHEMVRGFTRAGQTFGIEVQADIRHPLGAGDFSSYFPRIVALKPDILILCNFGNDILNSVKQASDLGIKKSTKIIVPQLLYYGRLAAGPMPYEGVLGGTVYYWGLEDSVPSAKAFNDRYRAAYNGAYPSDYGALAYSGVKTVLTAVKNAGTTDTDKVIEAMRALKYDFYKGPQYFRACDHQAVAPVLIIESKRKAEMKNEYDVFKILVVDKTDESKLRTCEELGHKA